MPWQEAQLVAKAADKVPEGVVVVGVVGEAGDGDDPLDELQPPAVSRPTTVALKINERIKMAFIESTPLKWFT